MYKTFTAWWCESTGEQKDNLAAELSCNRNWLSGVAHNRAKAARTSKIAIASVLNQPVESLFPLEQPLQREHEPRFHGIDKMAVRV